MRGSDVSVLPYKRLLAATLSIAFCCLIYPQFQVCKFVAILSLDALSRTNGEVGTSIAYEAFVAASLFDEIFPVIGAAKPKGEITAEEHYLVGEKMPIKTKS